MKKALFVILLGISSLATATSYYIKNGGNDLLSGTSESEAWESISKVNSFTFSPGDYILFKRGDAFVGTLTPSSSGSSTSYITFGAYGTGDDPIITPNDYISGLTWTVHSGNVYKTTGIKFNPGNILINGTTKINKINDDWFTKSNSHYGGYTALQLLGLDESKTFSINNVNVYFWDGLDALYCYDSGTETSYIRFRAGDNPNSKSLAVAPVNSNAVYINAKRYIIVQNLQIIGGEVGVYLNAINYSGSNNVIIENCNVESSQRKIYSKNNSQGITIRNNTVTNKYLSPYTPGAWEYTTNYLCGVRRHYYEFFKYVIGTTDSTPADEAINTIGNNNETYGNTITNCVNGISVGTGSSNVAHDNSVENVSSVAIHFSRGTMNCSAYNNYVRNANICFRFQYVDDANYAGRINYVYRNRVYNVDAGQVAYLHYTGANPSVTTIYFYANSFICKDGIAISGYAGDNPDPTGMVFINNIISASNSVTCASADELDDRPTAFVWKHNWTSGSFDGTSGIALYATDASNLNHVKGPTFWNHATDPPDFTDIAGTEVIDAAIDVSKTFTLGGVNYSALPGISSDDHIGNPDIGAYEYSVANPNLKPVTNIAVTGTGGATTITSDNGTLQLSAVVLPSDATTKTVTWSITNGTGQATISPSGLVTAASNGTVTARATARDGSGVYGTLLITISNQVIPVTGITVTGAGGAATITTDKGTLQLSAVISPSNATTKTVTWSIANGTGQASISSSGLVTSIGNGTVTARATANDGSGVYGSLPLTILNQVTQTNQSPIISIASPVKNSSFTAPSTIIIDAIASDPDGTITKVEFFNGSTELGELTTTPYSYTWKDVPEGTYSLTASATDNLNSKTLSETVIITVNKVVGAVNQLPVVSITSPKNNSSIEAPSTVTITANASDIDGTISKVEYYNGMEKIGESSINPYTVLFECAQSGTYEITAIATDNLNAVASSTSVILYATFYCDNPDIINLYPNPSDGMFAISLLTPLLSEENKVIVTTFNGEIVYSGILLKDENNRQFDLSYLDSGIYILMIRSDEIVFTKKFIKT